MLEQLIRERQLTLEEFAEYAEIFAGDHGEPGTLSARHLQRLVAGRKPDGAPLGPVRPATARLLERIFDRRIGRLLAPPDLEPDVTSTAAHVLRVAVAVVINQSDVLIVCRRGHDGGEPSWQFPAGMVKPGVLPETVAVRETLEETGVHCVVQRQLGRRLHPVTNVICDYVLCEYLTGDAQNGDVVENVGVTWVHMTKLARFIPLERVFPPVLDALRMPQGQ